MAVGLPVPQLAKYIDALTLLPDRNPRDQSLAGRLPLEILALILFFCLDDWILTDVWDNSNRTRAFELAK